MAFFSIIIPTYNSEGTIICCLQSLAEQNFKDFEILVVDAASSDKTIELINDFFEKNPDIRYRVISEKDEGIFDAMNKGAALAKSIWLYFLGSDDWLISNDTLSKVYPALSRKDSPDFFYGNVLLENTGQVYDGKFSIRRLLSSNISHQAIFIKRTLFNELGPFDLQFEVYADWDLNIKVFQARKKIEYMDIVIGRYGNQGFSSYSRDICFEEKLGMIKKAYYKHLKNRLNSRIQYLKKKMKRYFFPKQSPN